MGWEKIEVPGGVTVHHDDLDGLSTYWVEDGSPFRAVLVFRAGMADETLPTRGICHLVEHLAIEAAVVGSRRIRFEGAGYAAQVGHQGAEGRLTVHGLRAGAGRIGQS